MIFFTLSQEREPKDFMFWIQAPKKKLVVNLLTRAQGLVLLLREIIKAVKLRDPWRAVIFVTILTREVLGFGFFGFFCVVKT